MNDNFSKGVLAVIAAALCAIAVRVWVEPRQLTWGELREASAEERNAIYGRAAVIRLQGGTTSVSVDR